MDEDDEDQVAGVDIEEKIQMCKEKLNLLERARAAAISSSTALSSPSSSRGAPPSDSMKTEEPFEGSGPSSKALPNPSSSGECSNHSSDIKKMREFFRQAIKSKMSKSGDKDLDKADEIAKKWVDSWIIVGVSTDSLFSMVEESDALVLSGQEKDKNALGKRLWSILNKHRAKLPKGVSASHLTDRTMEFVRYELRKKQRSSSLVKHEEQPEVTSTTEVKEEPCEVLTFAEGSTIKDEPLLEPDNVGLREAPNLVIEVNKEFYEFIESRISWLVGGDSEDGKATALEMATSAILEAGLNGLSLLAMYGCDNHFVQQGKPPRISDLLDASLRPHVLSLSGKKVCLDRLVSLLLEFCIQSRFTTAVLSKEAFDDYHSAVMRLPPQDANSEDSWFLNTAEGSEHQGQPRGELDMSTMKVGDPVEAEEIDSNLPVDEEEFDQRISQRSTTYPERSLKGSSQSTSSVCDQSVSSNASSKRSKSQSAEEIMYTHRQKSFEKIESSIFEFSNGTDTRLHCRSHHPVNRMEEIMGPVGGEGILEDCVLVSCCIQFVGDGCLRSEVMKISASVSDSDIRSRKGQQMKHGKSSFFSVLKPSKGVRSSKSLSKLLGYCSANTVKSSSHSSRHHSRSVDDDRKKTLYDHRELGKVDCDDGSECLKSFGNFLREVTRSSGRPHCVLAFMHIEEFMHLMKEIWKVNQKFGKKSPAISSLETVRGVLFVEDFIRKHCLSFSHPDDQGKRIDLKLAYNVVFNRKIRHGFLEADYRAKKLGDVLKRLLQSLPHHRHPLDAALASIKAFRLKRILQPFEATFSELQSFKGLAVKIAEHLEKTKEPLALRSQGYLNGFPNLLAPNSDHDFKDRRELASFADRPLHVAFKFVELFVFSGVSLAFLKDLYDSSPTDLNGLFSEIRVCIGFSHDIAIAEQDEDTKAEVVSVIESCIVATIDWLRDESCVRRSHPSGRRSRDSSGDDSEAFEGPHEGCQTSSRVSSEFAPLHQHLMNGLVSKSVQDPEPLADDLIRLWELCSYDLQKIRDKVSPTFDGSLARSAVEEQFRVELHEKAKKNLSSVLPTRYLDFLIEATVDFFENENKDQLEYKVHELLHEGRSKSGTFIAASDKDVQGVDVDKLLAEARAEFPDVVSSVIGHSDEAESVLKELLAHLYLTEDLTVKTLARVLRAPDPVAESRQLSEQVFPTGEQPQLMELFHRLLNRIIHSISNRAESNKRRWLAGEEVCDTETIVSPPKKAKKVPEEPPEDLPAEKVESNVVDDGKAGLEEAFSSIRYEWMISSVSCPIDILKLHRHLYFDQNLRKAVQGSAEKLAKLINQLVKIDCTISSSADLSVDHLASLPCDDRTKQLIIKARKAFLKTENDTANVFSKVVEDLELDETNEWQGIFDYLVRIFMEEAKRMIESGDLEGLDDPSVVFQGVCQELRFIVRFCGDLADHLKGLFSGAALCTHYSKGTLKESLERALNQRKDEMPHAFSNKALVDVVFRWIDSVAKGIPLNSLPKSKHTRKTIKNRLAIFFLSGGLNINPPPLSVRNVQLSPFDQEEIQDLRAAKASSAFSSDYDSLNQDTSEEINKADQAKRDRLSADEADVVLNDLFLKKYGNLACRNDIVLAPGDVRIVKVVLCGVPRRLRHAARMKVKASAEALSYGIALNSRRAVRRLDAETMALTLMIRASSSVILPKGFKLAMARVLDPEGGDVMETKAENQFSNIILDIIRHYHSNFGVDDLHVHSFLQTVTFGHNFDLIFDSQIQVGRYFTLGSLIFFLCFFKPQGYADYMEVAVMTHNADLVSVRDSEVIFRFLTGESEYCRILESSPEQETVDDDRPDKRSPRSQDPQSPELPPNTSQEWSTWDQVQISSVLKHVTAQCNGDVTAAEDMLERFLLLVHRVDLDLRRIQFNGLRSGRLRTKYKCLVMRKLTEHYMGNGNVFGEFGTVSGKDCLKLLHGWQEWDPAPPSAAALLSLILGQSPAENPSWSSLAAKCQKLYVETTKTDGPLSLFVCHRKGVIGYLLCEMDSQKGLPEDDVVVGRATRVLAAEVRKLNSLEKEMSEVARHSACLLWATGKNFDLLTSSGSTCKDSGNRLRIYVDYQDVIRQVQDENSPCHVLALEKLSNYSLIHLKSKQCNPAETLCHIAASSKIGMNFAFRYEMELVLQTVLKVLCETPFDDDPYEVDGPFRVQPVASLFNEYEELLGHLVQHFSTAKDSSGDLEDFRQEAMAAVSGLISAGISGNDLRRLFSQLDDVQAKRVIMSWNLPGFVHCSQSSFVSALRSYFSPGGPSHQGRPAVGEGDQDLEAWSPTSSITEEQTGIRFWESPVTQQLLDLQEKSLRTSGRLYRESLTNYYSDMNNDETGYVGEAVVKTWMLCGIKFDDLELIFSEAAVQPSKSRMELKVKFLTILEHVSIFSGTTAEFASSVFDQTVLYFGLKHIIHAVPKSENVVFDDSFRFKIARHTTISDLGPLFSALEKAFLGVDQLADYCRKLTLATTPDNRLDSQASSGLKLAARKAFCHVLMNHLGAPCLEDWRDTVEAIAQLLNCCLANMDAADVEDGELFDGDDVDVGKSNPRDLDGADGRNSTAFSLEHLNIERRIGSGSDLKSKFDRLAENKAPYPCPKDKKTSRGKLLDEMRDMFFMEAFNSGMKLQQNWAKVCNTLSTSLMNCLKAADFSVQNVVCSKLPKILRDSNTGEMKTRKLQELSEELEQRLRKLTKPEGPIPPNLAIDLFAIRALTHCLALALQRKCSSADNQRHPRSEEQGLSECIELIDSSSACSSPSSSEWVSDDEKDLNYLEDLRLKTRTELAKLDEETLVNPVCSIKNEPQDLDEAFMKFSKDGDSASGQVEKDEEESSHPLADSTVL